MTSRSIYPDDPHPPKKKDGIDVVGVTDLDWIKDGLFAVQQLGLGGNAPADRSDIAGKNFGSLAENFRAVSRIATGTIAKEVSFLESINIELIDGSYVIVITWGNQYWAVEKFPFLTDKSSRMFTEPPLVFFQCTDRRNGTSSVTASYDFMGTFKVTTSYFQALVGARSNVSFWRPSSNKWAYFEWMAIQPAHGYSDQAGSADTES